MRACRRQHAWQGGAALITALLLVLAALMLGVSAARAALNAEKSARVERDRHLAFAAAQAALADAERDIAGVAAVFPGRAALFDAAGTGFPDDCGRGGENQGLCTAAPGSGTPAWQLVDLAGDLDSTVAYGSFTGAQMATGSAGLPARLPRYIVELVPQPGAAQAAGTLFRITAIGFGARQTTHVVLQSFYRKPPTGQGSGVDSAGEPASPMPTGRTGWRELANWRDLHEAATQ